MQKAVIALVLIFCAGCSNDIIGTSNIRGLYTLRSVDSKPLPYTVAVSGSNKTEIVADSMTLYEGNTYAGTRWLRFTANGQTTSQMVSRTGTYTPSQGAVFFTVNEGATSHVAVFEGRSLKISTDGVIWVWTK